MADKNSNDGVVAFLLGGVLGAVLGVLLAPRKGEETREMLAKWLEENRERTAKFLEEEKELLASGKEKLEAVWDAGKQAFGKPANGNPKHS